MGSDKVINKYLTRSLQKLNSMNTCTASFVHHHFSKLLKKLREEVAGRGAQHDL